MPSIQELGQAGRAFASGEISQSQLEQISSGNKTLNEIQEPEPEPQPEENTNNTDQQQQDSSSSPKVTTNPGGSVGNNQQQQQQQQGIDAPSIQELGQAGKEFASSGGNVSQDDLENLDTRFKADVNNDQRINDQDAQALADQGQFETAQTLEDEIDQVLGTENDGTPDNLKPPTVKDVLGTELSATTPDDINAQDVRDLRQAAAISDKITEQDVNRADFVMRSSGGGGQSGDIFVSTEQTSDPRVSKGPASVAPGGEVTVGVEVGQLVRSDGRRNKVSEPTESVDIFARDPATGETVQIADEFRADAGPDGGPNTSLARVQIPESFGEGEAEIIVDPDIASVTPDEGENEVPGQGPVIDEFPVSGQRITSVQDIQTFTVDISEEGAQRRFATRGEEIRLAPDTTVFGSDAQRITGTASGEREAESDPDVISGDDAQAALDDETIAALGGESEAAAALSEELNVTERERATQQLEQEIDTATGTEGDGTPDSLTAPTVEDVIGEDRQVDSAQEADALAEAARQSDEISEKQARKLLDQAADQGSLRSQNNILNRDDTQTVFGQEFSDQPGSVAFSRFEVKAPGGSTNPSLRERTNVNDQLIIDRRGSRGRIESITINGEEVQTTPRPVGPFTERGGDEKRNRLVVDIPEGIDPGIADISIQESFGPQDNPDDRFFFGTETTQLQALLTEQAPIVDNQAFEETFQGTQTQDRITNPDVISGSEAQSLLGEDTVQDLGGQQEAAAEVSRIINQTPEEKQQSQQSSNTRQQSQQEKEQSQQSSNTRQQSQQEKEQSQQSNPIVEEGSLADTVGSVTRDREDPTFNDESATVGRAIDDAVAKANRNLSGRREAAADNAQQERANKQGETRASVNRVGQQQLNAQTQKETETFGDIPIQNPLTGNRLEDDLSDVAQEFQDSSETVFSNLGRVQPTPVTIGTGGTRTADETTSGIRGAGLEGFISGINPAEIALDSKEIAEFVIKRGDEAGEIVLKPTADLLAGNQVDTTTELQDDLNTEASAIEEQARKNPAQTTASVIGGVAGGVAGGFAAARGARGAIRGARSLDLDSSDITDAVSSAQQRSTGSSSSITGGDIDAINDIFDKRIRFDGGRDRKQKQIEKTEEIERNIIDQDQLDELEQRQGLDDSISDIEQTARRRLPPQRQFETEGEFRRELERAMRQEEKQRLKSQSESDSNTQRGTNTDTDTRTRTTELTSAAVGGIAGGFGQISVETEPQVPNNQNDDTNDTAAVIGGSGGGFGQPEFEPVIQPDLNLGFGFGSVGQPEAAAGAGQSQSESLFGDDDTDAGFVVQLPETPLIRGIDEEITQEIGDQDQISFPIEDIGEQTETQIETGIQEEITTPEIQQGQETDLQREQDIQRQQEIELETQLELNQKKRKKELEIPPFGQPQETEIQPSETFAGVRNVESTLTQRELDIQ